MALREKKVLATCMREHGASYSQIKLKLGVSKSTLSLWLRDMPLSENRLRALRDFSVVRIEKYRNTRKKTREARWQAVRAKALKDIGSLSRRELFIAGLFLYWGEGTKTEMARTSLANTDPLMLKFFIKWLEFLGVSKNRLRVKIHLYRDMDIKKELKYWSKTLGIPLTQFNKSYIKGSSQSGLSYPQKFIHGTGNVAFGNRDVAERVLMSLDCIRTEFAEGQLL